MRQLISGAELVLASELTIVECERVLIRAVALNQLGEADLSARRAWLQAAAAHWTLFALDRQILERACRPFPKEPIRTLDALHLSTAVFARTVVPDVRFLSLDDRVRSSARELGFEVLPDGRGGS